MKNHWLNVNWNKQIATDRYWDNLTLSNRKLHATWSRESQEDIRAIHNLMVEKELADAVARELRLWFDAIS